MCYLNCTITVIFSQIRLDECIEIILEKCAEKENYKPDVKKLILKSESSINDQVAESIEMESNPAPEMMMRRFKRGCSLDHRDWKNSEKKLCEIMQCLDEYTMPYEKYPERSAEDWAFTGFVCLMVLVDNLSVKDDCELFCRLLRWSKLIPDTNESKEEQRRVEHEVHKQLPEICCEKSSSVLSKSHSLSSSETYKEDIIRKLDQILRIGSSKMSKKRLNEEIEFIVMSQLYPILDEIIQKMKDREMSSQLLERRCNIVSVDESINNVQSPCDSNMSDNSAVDDVSMDSFISDTDTKRNAFHLVQVEQIIKMIDSHKNNFNNFNLKEERSAPPEAPVDKGKKRKKQSCDFISENACHISDHTVPKRQIFHNENDGQISKMEDSHDQKIGKAETSLDKMSDSINSKDEVQAPRNKKGNKRKKKPYDFISENTSHISDHKIPKRRIFHNENDGQISKMEDSPDLNIRKAETTFGKKSNDINSELVQAPRIKNGNKRKKKSCDFISENDSHMSDHTAPKILVFNNENMEQISKMKGSDDQNIINVDADLDVPNSINLELLEISKPYMTRKRNKKSHDFILENETCSLPYLDEFLNNIPSPCNSKASENLTVDDVSIDTHISNCTGTKRKIFRAENVKQISELQESNKKNIGDMDTYLNKVSDSNKFNDGILELAKDPNEERNKRKRKSCGSISENDADICDLAAPKRQNFDAGNAGKISKIEQSVDGNISMVERFDDRSITNVNLNDDVSEFEPEVSKNNKSYKRKTNFCEFSSVFFGTCDNAEISSEDMRLFEAASGKTTRDYLQDGYLKHRPKKSKMYSEDVSDIPYLTDITENHYQMHNRDDKSASCNEYHDNRKETAWITDWDKIEVSGFRKGAFIRRTNKYNDVCDEFALEPDRNKNTINYEKMEFQIYEKITSDNLSSATYSANSAIENSATYDPKSVYEKVEPVIGLEDAEKSASNCLSDVKNIYNEIVPQLENGSDFSLEDSNEIACDDASNESNNIVLCEKTGDLLSRKLSFIRHSNISPSTKESDCEIICKKNSEDNKDVSRVIYSESIDLCSDTKLPASTETSENADTARSLENHGVKALDNVIESKDLITHENRDDDSKLSEGEEIYKPMVNLLEKTGRSTCSIFSDMQTIACPGNIENSQTETILQLTNYDISPPEDLSEEGNNLEIVPENSPKQSILQHRNYDIASPERTELTKEIRMDNQALESKIILHEAEVFAPNDLSEEGNDHGNVAENSQTESILQLKNCNIPSPEKIELAEESQMVTILQEAEVLAPNDLSEEGNNHENVTGNSRKELTEESQMVNQISECKAILEEAEVLAPNVLSEEGNKNCDIASPERIELTEESQIVNQVLKSKTILQEAEVLSPKALSEEGNKNCDIGSPERIELTEESQIVNQVLESKTILQEAEVLEPKDLSEEGNNHEIVAENSQKESILQLKICNIASPERIELTEQSQMVNQVLESKTILEEAKVLAPKDFSEEGNKNCNIASPERIELTEESQMVNQISECKAILEEAEVLAPNVLSEEGNKNWYIASPERIEFTEESQMVNQVFESKNILQEAEVLEPKDLSEEVNKNCDIASPTRIEFTEESQMVNEVLESKAILEEAEVLAPNVLSEEGNNHEIVAENSEKESILQLQNCNIASLDRIELTEQSQMVNEVLESKAILEEAEVLAPNVLSEEGNNHEIVAENSEKESILQPQNCNIASPDRIELTEQSQMVNQVLESKTILQEAEVLAPKDLSEEVNKNYDIASPTRIEFTEENQMVNQVLESKTILQEAEVLASNVFSQEGNNHEKNNGETGASQLEMVIHITPEELFSRHQGSNRIHPNEELCDFADTTTNAEMSVRSIDSNIIHEEIEFTSPSETPHNLSPTHLSVAISSPESRDGEITLLEDADASCQDVKFKDVITESEVSLALSPTEDIPYDQIDEQTKNNTGLLMDDEIIIHPEIEQKMSSNDLEKMPSEGLSDKLNIDEVDLSLKIKDVSHFTQIQHSLPEIDAQSNCLPSRYSTDSNGKKNLENICPQLETLSPTESNINMSLKFTNNLQKPPCESPPALSSVVRPLNSNTIKEKPVLAQNYQNSIKETFESGFERSDALNYLSVTSPRLEFDKLISHKIESSSKCKQVAPSPNHLLQNGYGEAFKPRRDITLPANIRHDNYVSSITKTDENLATKCACKPTVGLKNIRIGSCDDKEILPMIESGIKESVINADGILNQKQIFVEVLEDLTGKSTDSGLSSLENEISDSSTEYIPTAEIVDEVMANSYSESVTDNVEEIRKENDIQIDIDGSPPSNAYQLLLLKTSNANENNVENLLSEKTTQVVQNDLNSNNISVDGIINTQNEDNERAPDQSTNYPIEQNSPQVSAGCQKSGYLSACAAELADNSIDLHSSNRNIKPILHTNLKYYGQITETRKKEDYFGSELFQSRMKDTKDIGPTYKREGSFMQAKGKAKNSFLDESAKCHTLILHKKDAFQVHFKTNIVDVPIAALPEKSEIALDYKRDGKEIEKSQNKEDIENTLDLHVENETLLKRQSKYNIKDLSDGGLSCDNVINLENFKKQPKSKSNHMNSHESYHLPENKEKNTFISNEVKKIVNKLSLRNKSKLNGNISLDALKKNEFIHYETSDKPNFNTQDDFIDQGSSRKKQNIAADPLSIISIQNPLVMGEKSEADIIDPITSDDTSSTSNSSSSDKHDKDITYQVKVIDDLKLSIIRKRSINTYIDNNYKIESKICENDDTLCQQNAISPVFNNNKEDCKLKDSSNEVLDSSLPVDDFDKLPKETKIKHRRKADHKKCAALTKIYARKPNIIQDKISKTDFPFAELEINAVTKDNNISGRPPLEKNYLTSLKVLDIIFQNIASDLRQNPFQKFNVNDLNNLAKKIRVFVDDEKSTQKTSKETCDIFDRVKNIGKQLCQTIGAAVGKNQERITKIVKQEGTINNKKVINNLPGQLGIRNFSNPCESIKSGALEINMNQNEDSSIQKKDQEKPDLVQGSVSPDLLTRLPEHNLESPKLTDTSKHKLVKKKYTSGSKRPNDHQIKIITAKRYKQFGKPEIPPWQRRRHAKFTDPVVEVETCNTKVPKGKKLKPSKTRMRHDHIDVKPVMPRKLALRNGKLSKKTSSEENTNTSERPEILTGNSEEVADTDVSQHVEISDVSESVVVDTKANETNTEIQNSASEEDKAMDCRATEKEKPSGQINQTATEEVFEEPITNAVLNDIVHINTKDDSSEISKECGNNDEISKEIQKTHCEQSDSNLNKCNEKEMKKYRMDRIISLIAEHRKETVIQNNRNETESCTNIIATPAWEETTPAYPQSPLDLTSTSSKREEVSIQNTDITTPNETPTCIQNVQSEDSTLVHKQQYQNLAQLPAENAVYASSYSYAKLFQAHNLPQSDQDSLFTSATSELLANMQPRDYEVADVNRHLDNAAAVESAPHSMTNMNDEQQIEQSLPNTYVESYVTTPHTLSLVRTEEEMTFARRAELVKENTPILYQQRSSYNTRDNFGRYAHHNSSESSINHEHDQIQNGPHVSINKKLNKQTRAQNIFFGHGHGNYQLNAEVEPARTTQRPCCEFRFDSHDIGAQRTCQGCDLNINPIPETRANDKSKRGADFQGIRCKPANELFIGGKSFFSTNISQEAGNAIQESASAEPHAVQLNNPHTQLDAHAEYRIQIVENSQRNRNEDDMQYPGPQHANIFPPHIQAQIRGQMGAYNDIVGRNDNAILQRNRIRAPVPAGVSRGRNEISAAPNYIPQSGSAYLPPTPDSERNGYNALRPPIHPGFTGDSYISHYENQRLNSNRLRPGLPANRMQFLPFQTPQQHQASYTRHMPSHVPRPELQGPSTAYLQRYQQFLNTHHPYRPHLPPEMRGLGVNNFAQFQNSHFSHELPQSHFSPTLPEPPVATPWVQQLAKKTRREKIPVRKTK